MNNKITFARAVQKTFASWRDYRGSASRREYWFFFLFLILLSLVTSTIDRFIAQGNQGSSLVTFSSLVQLVLYIWLAPLLARRYHDAGFSAWWLLLQLLPFAILIYKIPTILAFAKSPLLNRAAEGANLNTADSLKLVTMFFDAFGLWLLTAFAFGLFNLVVTLLPTKQLWQGNRYITPTEPEHLWGYTVAGQNGDEDAK